MASASRLERETYALEERCSILLSYAEMYTIITDYISLKMPRTYLHQYDQVQQH